MNNDMPKFAYVAYVGTNERDIVLVEDIKNFNHAKHEPKIKYKVKWHDQFYYATIAFFGDSEESINDQAEKNRPKFIPEHLLVSNDESEECTISTETFETKSSTVLSTKLALLLEKQTEQSNHDTSDNQGPKERTDERRQKAIDANRDGSRKDQKIRIDNDDLDIEMDFKKVKNGRVEKITMLEHQLAESKKDNRCLRVEVDKLKSKNKELQDSADEFQKLNLLLQRDAIQSIEDMRIQLSTLLNKPALALPQADQLEFPEVGFVRVSDNSIHIGRGVWLKNEIYDTIYCTSKSPSLFITNMAIAVFGTTCLKGSTVTGKKSNRTKSKSVIPARPALDAKKLLAIEDIFRFWLEKSKKNSVEINNELFKMTSYISKKISQLNYVKKNGNSEDQDSSCSGQKIIASPSSASNMSM